MNESEPYNYEDQHLESITDSQFHGSFLSSPEALLNKFKNYRAKSGIINIKDLSDSQNLKLKKYRAACFYGEFVNGKRHGKGIMLYNNGRKYQGEWECDLKHGKGYEEFQNGSVYKGFFVNGKPEGLGRLQWPNGEFYEGQWLAGLKHGSGMWNGAKGDSYIGQWKLGKADGYGVHVWVNGDRYEGQFKQNLKHGQGSEKFVSGDLYKGSFFMGKAHGYGEYYWAGGSFYKGNFRNGFRDGSGTWKNGVNQDKYEGQYVKDKKQGYGIFTWGSGNVYKGHYMADLREGYGEMYWDDGSYYKGEWRRGAQEGEGVTWSTDNGLQKGRFSNNMLVELFEQIQQVINEPKHKKIVTRRKVHSSNRDNPKIESKQQNKTKHPYILIRQRVKSKAQQKQNTLNTMNHHQKLLRSKPETVNHSPDRSYSKGKVDTARKIKYQSMQLQPQEGAKNSKIPHSSIMMKYLDRRVLVGSIRRNQIGTLRSKTHLSQKRELSTRL